MDAPRVIWLKSFGVWLLISILLTPPNLVGFTIHDEGFIATGAMLLLDGKLLYRDFLSFYGPAQYYLVAFLFGLFGEDLLVLRLLHVCWLAALCTAVWAVCRKVVGSTSYLPVLATVAVLALTLYVMPSSGYPAIPTTVFLLLASLPLFDWNPDTRSRRLMTTSALVGVAGLFRWDFGLFGLTALVVAIVATLWSRKAPLQGYGRSIAQLVTPAVVIMGICYVPLLGFAADPRRWLHEIVEYSVYEVPKWRRVPLGLSPRDWLGALAHGYMMAAFNALVRQGFVIVPAGLSITALLWLSWRLIPIKGPRLNTDLGLFYLALITLLLLNQMRVRARTWQGFPAMAAAIPLAVYVFVTVETKFARYQAVRWSARAAASVCLLAAVVAGLPAVRTVFDSRLVPLSCDRAHLIRVWPTDAQYGDMVRYVRTHTSDGDDIYSGALDHSKLHSNDSLLYFLSRRLPADRFVELEPGIANTLSGQREIRDTLDAMSVPLVVLVALEKHEPNLTSSSNGVFVLDEFIRAHYVKDASFGSYTLLRREPRPQ